MIFIIWVNYSFKCFLQRDLEETEGHFLYINRERHWQESMWKEGEKSISEGTVLFWLVGGFIALNEIKHISDVGYFCTFNFLWP